MSKRFGPKMDTQPIETWSTEKKEQVKAAIYRYLESGLSRGQLGSNDTKVFHRLGYSYSIAELKDEVEKETELGRLYIQAIAWTAAEDGLTVGEFLSLGNQVD